MKRIIFVDDEQNILDGLKRLLRPTRHIWDMTFVTSAESALEAMANDPFDVLVTDMVMPGMNGAELLERVQERNPQTVRIVLSGYSDFEGSMRTVSSSHQCLSKPCDARTLKRVVDRACRLECLLREPSLQAAVGIVSRLPVLPRLYRDLTSALQEEEVDIEAVGRIVEQDVGIAAKILQLVNSSFFGLSSDICDLRQATAYLGIDTIRDLALSFQVFEQFEGGQAVEGFSLDREQGHSLLSARIARKLLTDKKESEHAFLAALLHDVGKLILLTHVTEQFRGIRDAGAGVTRPAHRVEEEFLGVSHAEIGAYLLGLWGMPYCVVEAVAYHHHPARVLEQKEFSVVGATHVAEALAREVDGSAPETIELDLNYLRRVGVIEKLPEWRALAAEEASIDRAAA